MQLWLIRLIGLFFFLLPAWSVNESSDFSRAVIGFAFLCMYFVFLFFVESRSNVAEKESKEELNRRSFCEKYRKYVWLCFGVSFVIAEIISIAATYGDAGMLGSLGRATISVGERLFPVVAGYANLMEPPLSIAELFRVQTTVSAFYLAVLVVSAAYVAYVVAAPVDEGMSRFYIEPMGLFEIIWTAVAFLIFLAFAAAFIFGWINFWGGSSCRGKGSIFSAECYVKDGDLGLFTMLPLKLLMLFLTPMAVANFAKANLHARRMRNERSARSRRRTRK